MKPIFLASLAVAAVSVLCLVNADARSPRPAPATARPAAMIGVTTPMPDLFGSILTTR